MILAIFTLIVIGAFMINPALGVIISAALFGGMIDDWLHGHS